MKIAFYSLNCLFDPVSGAAISVRTLLEGLAARGHEVCVVTAACFDRPDHGNEGDMLTSVGFEDVESHWTRTENGVRHIAIPSGKATVLEMTPAALSHAARDALDHIEDFGPDVMLSYGGTSAETTVRAHMSRQDTPNAFYLANPNYRDPTCFADVDLVMCDTPATSEHYRTTLGLDPAIIGKFIEPVQRVEGERPRYVTFINPSYEKGVTLFFRIAEMMAEHQPDIVFQVVESRQTLATVERANGLPFSKLANIRLSGPQRKMERIFSRTKVLLIPSLWHESGPRIALEAMSLGIPIVASDHIGVREQVEGAGTLISAHEKLRQVHRLIPPARTALPWVAAIERLMTDDEAYRDSAAAAHRNWDAYTKTDVVGRLDGLLTNLVDT